MSRPGDRQARSRADVSPRSIGPWMPPAPCFASHTPFPRHVVTPTPSPEFWPFRLNWGLSRKCSLFTSCRGAFPLFQLRNHDSRHSVAKLDLLYTPFTWSTPLQVGRAWKVHHMIHLTGDIPHVTSDRARKGGRQLRRPILPAPPPRFRPFKPLVQNDPPNWTKSRTFALRFVVDV